MKNYHKKGDLRMLNPFRTWNLSIRTVNCLSRAGIETIEQLCRCTEDELLTIRGMTRHNVEELTTELTKWGFSLSQESSGVLAELAASRAPSVDRRFFPACFPEATSRALQRAEIYTQEQLSQVLGENATVEHLSKLIGLTPQECEPVIASLSDPTFQITK